MFRLEPVEPVRADPGDEVLLDVDAVAGVRVLGDPRWHCDVVDPVDEPLGEADDLRRAIEQGEYQVGQRLPAGRTLAKQYQVGLNTAQRAVELLKSDGLVVSYPARGVFVRSRERGAKPEGDSSAEFVEIMRQIDLLKAGLRDVQERLDPLEEAVRNSQQELSKEH